MGFSLSPIVFLLLSIQAFAGGSIGWEHVKAQIARSDPELVKVIELNFAVNASGGGVRLGPHFGDRHGERVSPFEFGAVIRKTGEKVVLIMEENDDYSYTGRFKFTWRWKDKTGRPEPVGASQSGKPPTKELPGKVQPSAQKSEQDSR